MGAPENNQFWKLRSEHGRAKIFSSPNEVWEQAKLFFEWCDNNPLERVDVVKGGESAGMHISALVPRPYTLEGFCRFIDVTTNTFRNYENDDNYKDFFDTFARIRETIRQQKLEGAMIGNYHANLVARELNIGDSTDITSKGNEVKTVLQFGGKEIEI